MSLHLPPDGTGQGARREEWSRAPRIGWNCQLPGPLILIRDGTLTIQRYYLPTGAKRIRLTAIVGVEQYAMTRWTGKWRIWGTTLGRWWFNLDIGRPHKQQAFVIDLGRRVKPVLTPGDPEAFRAALATAGIPLATRTRGTGRRP